jgi:hypothetical protein
MNTINAFPSLSKKFGLFVLGATLFSLVGCASRKPLDTGDLMSYKVDCSIKEQQFEFLKNAIPTRAEVQADSIRSKFFHRWDDDEDVNYVPPGAYKWWVEHTIGKVYKQCEK